MSKENLRKEIKALRHQMANLDAACKVREDKVVELLFLLEPFITALPSDVQDKIKT